jgi:hypothetical protein
MLIEIRVFIIDVLLLARCALLLVPLMLADIPYVSEIKP